MPASVEKRHAKQNSHGRNNFRGEDHRTTPNFGHLFVGLNGASDFFPDSLVKLLGDGAEKHVRLKHVSLVRGCSFFRIPRGRTAGMVGTLGETG